MRLTKAIEIPGDTLSKQGDATEVISNQSLLFERLQATDQGPAAGPATERRTRTASSCPAMTAFACGPSPG